MALTNLFLLCLMGLRLNKQGEVNTKIVSRSEWNAQPSKLVEYFQPPSPFVIIHHSYIPGPCNSTTMCKKSMRSMQNYHQVDRGWNDIGYSFAIGGDGLIYAGRGFNVIGAHAPGYNNRSVGICFIGDYRYILPSTQMLEAAKTLINYGVLQGHIHRNYTLLGHRQVRNTECPGDRLFAEISTWPKFKAKVP